MSQSVPKCQFTTAPTVFLLFTVLLLLLCGLSGCASTNYLPSSKETIRSPWKSYAEIKDAFNQIQPYKTNISQLKELGFAPDASPNVQVLNYLDIMQRFLPNQSISLKDLDNGLQNCLAARNHCHGYAIDVHHTDAERYGNVFMDLFNFHRQTSITGWQFRGIVVLKNNLVIYKLSSGKPSINEFRDSRNPLGPLQNSERILWGMTKY